MPYDYFDAVPNYTDTFPDYRRLAREAGQNIAAARPLAHNGRAFWKLTDADSGALTWLAFTRPRNTTPVGRPAVTAWIWIIFCIVKWPQCWRSGL